MGNEKHTIQDLAAALSANNKLSRAKNEAFARAMFTLIRSELEKDGFVKVKGLGTFKIITVNSRESVDVNTGERIEISEHQRLSFVPDKLLKERVNRPFEAFETTIIEDDAAGETFTSENADSMAVEEMTVSKEMPQVNVKEPSEGTEETAKMQIETLMLDGNDSGTARDIQMDSTEDAVSEEPSNSGEAEEKNPSVSLLGENGDSSDNDVSLSYNEIHEQKSVEENVDEENMENNGWLKKTIGLLAVILLCIGSYIAGYNRLIDFSCGDNARIVCDMVPLVPADTIIDNDSTTAQPDSIVSASDAPTQSVLLKSSKNYEQMPDGEYLIVGELGEHEFRVGDSLLKLAIQKYGNKSFANYIIFYNRIKNPDIVPLGAVVRLPKLVDKTGNEIKK